MLHKGLLGAREFVLRRRFVVGAGLGGVGVRHAVRVRGVGKQSNRFQLKALAVKQGQLLGGGLGVKKKGQG